MVIYLLKDAGVQTRLTRILDENQKAGFTEGSLTNGHLHTVNRLIEKTTKFNKALSLAFVAYEKAFDSVEQEARARNKRTYYTILPECLRKWKSNNKSV